MTADNIKVILFDLGGVIIDLFPQKTMSALAQLANTSEDIVEQAYLEAAVFQQHEKGLINNADFRSEVQRRLQFNTTDVEFDQAWNAMLGDIPAEVLGAVSQLKEQYQCCVLSNTNAIHEKAFHQILAQQHNIQHLNEIFDEVYFSHELNERKPDKAIYLKVIKNLGVSAEEVLFLDDSEANIAAAKAVGIHGVYVPRNSGFQDLLKAYLKA